MFVDAELNERYPTLSQFSAPLMTAEREIVGRDYEISQLMAAMNRPELCNALLLAPPGSGKALANGTLIPVADIRGYVEIEKLVPGVDKVFDEEGRVQDVEGVFPQGLKRTFRVTLEGGAQIFCNDEHIWGARRSDWSVGLVDQLDAARAALAEEVTAETQERVRALTRQLWAAHRPLTLREIMDSSDGQDWYIPAGSGVQRDLTLAEFDDHLHNADVEHSAVVALQESMMLNVEDRLHFLSRVAPPDPQTQWLFTHDEAFAVAVRQVLASAGIRSDSGPFVDSHGPGIRLRPKKVPSVELRIVYIEELDVDVEMTCIKVSGPSALFQAGRDHIVTHNTALVQAAMLADTKRSYMEVDLAKMISSIANADQMAGLIKQLFNEAELFSTNEHKELVLFMDEFHQIVQLSPAAVEALKPVLAASGTRGIRIIAATTDDEFDKYIKPNQPLVERLQRIIVSPPNKKTTVSIMRGMAERYGVAEEFFNDHVFELIHEYTERYIPASTQPRKSILVLDSMVGWHKLTDRPMDRFLLADVLMESVGVNVAFRVDAVKIKEQLDSKVFSQQYATEVIAKRLQLCVADLQDKTKPISSFLFTGSTGVGKSEMTKQLAMLLFGDAKKHLIRFDMSEYARDDALDQFRHELTSRVWHTSHAVVLLDEIEKASPLVTRMLLQVLDDGRLSDANGRQVSFLNTYIVLTTNAGSEIFETIAQYDADDTGSGEVLKEKLKEIRRSITMTTEDNKFPPELLGRIDAIVPFQPLSTSTQRQIVMAKLQHFIQEVLTKHNTRVTIDPRVISFLIEDKGDTDSNAGGARAAIGLLTDEVATNVAAFINKYPNSRTVQVSIEGELVSDNKALRKSDAKVVVSLPPLG